MPTVNYIDASTAPKVRFAISLLNYSNKGKAINDELLIDKANGNLYYKKPNGIIVSCGGSGYSENVSVFESIYNLGLTKDDIWADASDNGLYVVTDTVIPNPHDMQEPYNPIGVEFLVDARSKRAFINVKTRDEDKHYVALLTFLRNINEPEPYEENAVVTLKFIAHRPSGLEDNPITTNVNIVLNQMSPITIPSQYNDTTMYDYITVKVEAIDSLVKSVYEPDKQFILNLFKDVMPDDRRIMYSKIDLAYFTPSNDTVFVSDTTTVVSIMDIHSAFEVLDRGDVKGYVEHRVYPLVEQLYRAGINTSREYVLSFKDTDWDVDETTGIGRLTIPSGVHKLKGELVISVYYLKDGLYRTEFGVWDETNYKVYKEADGKVVLTTEDPFTGKIIIRNFATFLDIEGEDIEDPILPGESTDDEGCGCQELTPEEIKELFTENSYFIDENSPDINDALGAGSSGGGADCGCGKFSDEIIDNLFDENSEDIGNAYEEKVIKFRIDVDMWKESLIPDYPFCADVPVVGMTDTTTGEMDFTAMTMATAIKSGVNPSAHTHDGYFTIFAKHIPEDYISGQLTLIRLED